MSTDQQRVYRRAGGRAAARGARVWTVLVASLCAMAAVLSPLAGRASAATPGSLVSWGAHDEVVVSHTPTGTGFTAVAAGLYHSVALRADGSLVAWGSDDYGQVSATPTGTGFTAVAAGNHHNVALRADGSLVSWGLDDYGQVSATPTGTGFTAVAGGGFHSLALRADGSLVSWGYDGSGQVSATPTGAGFTAVAAGGFHSLALRADGSLVSWGYDGSGQVSMAPAGAGFTAVAAGNHHSVALRADGSLVSWGLDDYGQVSATPTGTGFTAVAAGTLHSLALRADGSLVSWGYNSNGQVSGTPTGTGFTAVAAGLLHSVALRTPIALTSISVAPVNAAVARGATQQLTATGTFDDGTQQDLTGSVTWASSAPAATVDASGLATGRQVGSTTVSATSGSVTGSTTLTVTPTSLVVQAPAVSKAFGASVPPLAPSYVGLVVSDVATATPATCSTTATASSPVGSYPITCTGANDPNYVITYAPGTLTVGKTPTALSAQSVGVVRSLHSLNVRMTGNLRSLATGQPVAGETVGFTLGARSCSGTTDGAGNASCTVSIVTALLNLGSYSATYGGSAAYLPSSATGSVTLL